jgi:hypothetical protein
MPPVAGTQLAEQYGVPVSLITSHRKQVLKEGLSAIAELVAGLTPEKKTGGACGGPGGGSLSTTTPGCSGARGATGAA